MTLDKILEQRDWQMIGTEVIPEMFNKLLLAKQLAEQVSKDYEDAADWKDAKPKLAKLADRILS